MSYGHRVKEERDPQPRVASKPSSSSQPVVTYGKRVTAGKSNGESIYESYKQPYAKPTGYSMDVKVDGVGKKPENSSILNTVDSGISKSNSSNKGTNVVTYSNNKGNSYLRDKREEMYAGMKGDIQKDVPSINKNNNSGYIAAKKEQISTKIKEDKQSTYSEYDKYMKDNYINNKKAEISKGMKGDIQKDVPSINKNNNSGYIAAKKEQISTKIKEDKQSTYSIYDKYMKDNYINNKKTEISKGMKGDIQKDVPSINKNNNSGYIAAKKEQISTKIKEDKQSTYSIYDKYMKDSYINNKKAEIFEGMKPAYVKISENTKKESGVLDYLKKSGKQILLGNYTKDVTLLGTIGQIGAGLLDIDLPGDIRDIVYDVTHLELSWECAGRTALDIIGLLPVVGAMKYGDEVGTVVKTGVKNIDTVGDAAKETEIIGSAAKGLPKADEAGKLVDITVKNADTVDDVVKEGDKVTKGAEVKVKAYTSSRPSYSKGQVEQVWENAKDPVTGKVYDPTGKEITWDKSKPRSGQWDMGHIPGEKYSDMHELYMNGTISKEEFLEWYTNPENYRPELPSTNRSHKYE